ncbi:MAG: hypothetical protein V2A76_02795 [Planctomycetota bacterium]
MAEDFYSFEKVLRELHLQEEDLKKLVSEGEIRAFRDDDKMKFKAEDIERFKSASGDDLPTLDTPSGELTEELFGDDDAVGGDVGMVTQQISDSSFLEDELTDLDEPGEIELVDEPAPKGGRAGGGRRRAAGPAVGRSARRRGEADGDAGSEGVLMQVVMVLGAVVLLYACIVALNAAEVQSTGMTEGLMKFVADAFMKN